jgi:hypothetical protein
MLDSPNLNPSMPAKRSTSPPPSQRSASKKHRRSSKSNPAANVVDEVDASIALEDPVTNDPADALAALDDFFQDSDDSIEYSTAEEASCRKQETVKNYAR